MKHILLAGSVLAAPAIAYGQTCAAPPAAIAAGYTTQTGSLADFMNVNPSGASVSKNADGSITLTKTGGFNANADLQTMSGGQGIAFGNGGYIEATVAIQGTVDQSGGWPAVWANDIEKQSDPNSNISRWYEPDIMETFGPGSYGNTIHPWGSTGGLNNITDPNPNLPAVQYPAGFDPSQPHAYGMQWIPATASSKGSVTFFLDGVANNSIQWAQNDGSPFSQLDGRHLYLILGTGPNNPMTIYSANVWQNGNADNVGSSAGNIGTSGTCKASTVTGSNSTPPICLTAWPHAPSWCPNVSSNQASANQVQQDIGQLQSDLGALQKDISAPQHTATRQIRSAPTACE